MNNNIYAYVEKYKDYVDRIISKYEYPSNIAHFLYVIVPAFIYYYGIDKEQVILNTFSDIKIMFSKEQSNNITAYYSSTPYREDNKVKTYKYVYLYNYDTSSLVLFLDNLVHEFNHAINSYKNEISIRDNKVYIRTGISYITYDFSTLTAITKDKKSILEEVLNTKQTEDIINIILSIPLENDDSINNLLSALKKEINLPYKSNSYFLHSYICKYLLENKTFKSTLNVLRFNGDVEDIETWFDQIVGIDKSYEKLINNLDKITELSHTYEKKKFKFFIKSKIRQLNNDVIRIIEVFNSNCNYK